MFQRRVKGGICCIHFLVAQFWQLMVRLAPLQCLDQTQQIGQVVLPNRLTLLRVVGYRAGRIPFII